MEISDLLFEMFQNLEGFLKPTILENTENIHIYKWFLRMMDFLLLSFGIVLRQEKKAGPSLGFLLGHSGLVQPQQRRFWRKVVS